MMLAGVMMILYGVARVPALLGAAVFLTLLPLPITSAMFKSIMQVKTPPDMQGRVFAIVSQLAFISAPLSFLITGPLVDYLVEPAVGGSGWRVIAPVVGSDPGAGMGLVIAVAGLALMVSSALAYALPAIRHLETTLPDYEAIPTPGWQPRAATATD
jgi:hypothetical protein